MNRGTLCLLLGLGLFWAACQVGKAATTDVAILQVPDIENSDRFVTLWEVEDGGWIWLRAARPDRKWLGWIEKRSQVKLEVDGKTGRYTAEIMDDPDAHERVDQLMRAKYTWADQIRELLLGSDTVPVRLTPIEPQGKSGA
jgi:hypothetical protein